MVAKPKNIFAKSLVLKRLQYVFEAWLFISLRQIFFPATISQTCIITPGRYVCVTTFAAMQSSYETVIGLEVHIQLNTRSKAFSREPVLFGADANALTSVVSLAHPGALPVCNISHVHSAIKLGLALEGEVYLLNSFDRKHYFYPDSPKGYQITQDKHPIIRGGKVNLRQRTIGIHHIHMEDDAGKSLHDQDPNYSFVDLNRAGTPLLELVTEPDFRSGDEVAEFMEYLRKLVRWLDISDGNMEEGSLRCDVNISLRPVGSQTYGQRCEVKNINSMRFARKAIDYEVARQTAILDSGNTVEQETRGFLVQDGSTYSLRDKEDAHDYRYFPDPDLPPIRLTAETIARVQREMPHLPKAIEKTFTTQYNLSQSDAEVLTSERSLAEYALGLLSAAPPAHQKAVAQLLIQKLKPWAETRKLDFDALGLQAKDVLQLAELIVTGKVQQTAAYQKLVPVWLEAPETEPIAHAKALDLWMDDADTTDLTELAQNVLNQYPDKVAEYKKGKKNLMGLFMGELMRAAKGKAKPQDATKVLNDLLK